MQYHGNLLFPSLRRSSQSLLAAATAATKATVSFGKNTF